MTGDESTHYNGKGDGIDRQLLYRRLTSSIVARRTIAAGDTRLNARDHRHLDHQSPPPTTNLFVFCATSHAIIVDENTSSVCWEDLSECKSRDGRARGVDWHWRPAPMPRSALEKKKKYGRRPPAGSAIKCQVADGTSAVGGALATQKPTHLADAQRIARFWDRRRRPAIVRAPHSAISFSSSITLSRSLPRRALARTSIAIGLDGPL